MRVLLTNDDGYLAEGINILFETLQKRYDVYMVAPSMERSACSNALTMHNSVQVIKHDDRHFSVSGFPADCVNIGLHGNIIPEVDIVISGMNHGPNMGNDIHYSGTVAGARVAFVNKKTGIAVSVCGKTDSQRFQNTADFIADYISKKEYFNNKAPLFLNINYPDYMNSANIGIAYTHLDKRYYVDHYVILESTDNSKTIQLEGVIESERRDNSDYDMTQKGYISITPLTLDSTDYNMINLFSKKAFKVS
jgi:5'-nucleotidase